jgi:hypothetical protein
MIDKRVSFVSRCLTFSVALAFCGGLTGLTDLTGSTGLTGTNAYAQSAAPPPPPAGGSSSAATGSSGGDPTWYNTFYGTIAASVIMHGWGEVDVEDGDQEDIECEALGGVHLSGYYVMNPDFHIGGFFTYNEGDHEFEDTDYEPDFETIGIGLAFKYSRPFGTRVRLGAAFDFGYANFKDDESGVDIEGHGLYMSPRFSFDLLGLQFGSVKVGANVSLGLEIIPYAGGEIESGYGPDIDFDVWMVRLMLLLGLTIGS